jgi:hypothetical protein
MRGTLAVAVAMGLALASAWACDSSNDGTAGAPTADDGGGQDTNQDATEEAAMGDAAVDAALIDAALDVSSESAAPDASEASAFPLLGVYVVGTDGGGFALLADAGSRELSHVRTSADGGWLVATRYGKDPDNNGLAMENEVNFGAFYDGTEIVTFQRATPYAESVVAGTPDGGLAANPSWTADGKVLFITNAPGAAVTSTHLARATFSTVPSVTSIDAVPVPATHLVPVDPHQVGPSNASGTISFSATFQLSAKWMRPVWTMPATGTTSTGNVSFLGCPVCPLEGGCCGFSNLDDVLGTNDSRISHSGGDVLWMQQDPNVSVQLGSTTLYPYRQVMRPLDGGVQVPLTPAGTAATTTNSYGEWRLDDQEIAYWSIAVEGAVVRQHLYVMDRTGSNPRMVPLPASLCPLHPSYLSSTELVFNAWRADPADGSCDIARLP